MVGTSGAMRVLWKAESVEIPDGPWCYRADEKRFVMGEERSRMAGTSSPGCARRCASPSPEETERLLAEMEPDAHGLTFLPLLAGERGPDGRTRQTGRSPGSL